MALGVTTGREHWSAGHYQISIVAIENIYTRPTLASILLRCIDSFAQTLVVLSDILKPQNFILRWAFEVIK